MAKGFEQRSNWYVEKGKSLPEKERSHEAITAAAEAYLKAKDGGYAASVECLKRQDADPEFQRALRK